MRRIIAIAVGGATLAGCSSFSWDSLKPAPQPIQVQLESVPSGADAVTSVGPGCKTPCSVSVPAPDAGFSVTFALPKFQPVTVPVQVIRNPGDFATPASTTIDPNPVVAELKPAAQDASAAAEKAEAAEIRSGRGCPGGSPFPDPNAPAQPSR